MKVETILSLYERDLNKVITEINLYTKEENLWRVENNISNSAGNLALHLIGNLQTFIGIEIGKIPYVRDRELEFAAKNVPRTEIIAALTKTIEILKQSLQTLSDQDLQSEYPFLKFEKPASNAYLLIHLLSHLSYHLGQINYHRRLLDK